ncbi:MAG: protease modulator HflC [Lachnospiraceae bacterium]|nr:protease modulator HflC [Lachnospiraceae bacterium]
MKGVETMKKKIGAVLLGVLVFFGLIAITNCFYTVAPNQYAAVRQFGKIVKIESEPGLKVKTPFIQSVQKVSAATTLYDVPISDVITKDKKSMIADNYVLWKVVDPVKYIRTLDAIDARAEERIEAAVYNALKNVISSMTQDEVIEARGERLTQMLTNEANSDIGDYGIVVITAEIKALDLPDDNKAAVYTRMISERQNIAASYTAQGEAEAQKIRNETDREVTVMLANANKTAEIRQAEGEAEYMKILKEAYNTPEKAEFYNYIRSLDALKASLAGGNKTILLDKDSELARILYGNLEE